MAKRLCAFLLLQIVLIQLFAQTKLEIQVIDRDTKNIVPFASVVIKNNEKAATSTDLDGKANIFCKDSDTIRVRCLGYKQTLVAASGLIGNKRVEIIPDTILIGEVTVFAEDAYKLLLQARDSTNKYQSKSFLGTCYRQDRLSFNGVLKRKSDAKIRFNAKNAGSGQGKIDYWLDSIDNESFVKISEQPYLAYPNTIPLNLFALKRPSTKELATMKCSLASTGDDYKIVKVIKAKPTKNLINQATYYIDKNTLIIRTVLYEGNFKGTPVKQSNRYHYQTDIELSYRMDGDSCVLSNFAYELIFSHKKENPHNLWNYTVKMQIAPGENSMALPKTKKLRKLDYLMYK